MNGGPVLQLRIVHAGGAPQLRTFEADQVVLGRGRAADVRIVGGPISRRHVVLAAASGGWTVRRTGRHVPVTRNGVEIEFGGVAPLAKGDELAVEDWRLEVTLAGRADFDAWLAATRRTRGDRALLLRVDRPERAVEWMSFDRGSVVVGRSMFSDVVVDDGNVSRRHAILARSPGGWSVAHRGRLLPTRVAGEDVAAGTQAPLRDGDVVEVGPARIAVSISPASARAAEASTRVAADETPSSAGSPEGVAERPARVGAAPEALAPPTIEAGPAIDVGSSAGPAFPSTVFERGPLLEPTLIEPPGGAAARRGEPTIEAGFAGAAAPAPAGDDTAAADRVAEGGEPSPDDATQEAPSTWWEAPPRAPAGPASPPTTMTAVPRAAIVVAPRVLLEGRYRVEERTASAHLAEAWSARDEGEGGAVCVYEAPRVTLADPRRRDAFVADARRAAAIGHPGIERIRAVLENGAQVLVVTEAPSPRVLRDEIDDRVRAGSRFAFEEVAQVAESVADALAAAGPELPHGGLTPDFVRLEPDDAPRVAALGWRTVLVEEVRRGVRARTPYLAPEVRSGTPDWRADQFALAAILWEMLAGRPPAGATPSPRGLPETAPAAFRNALLRALAEDADARFPSWAAYLEGAGLARRAAS